MANRNQIKIAESIYSNGTLKNKLGIHNATELSEVEFMYSAQVTAGFLKHDTKITNIDQLKDIHRAMFGKIYNWAGKVRDFDISKQGHNFLPYSLLDTSSIYVNNLIKQINKKKRPSINDYANLLDIINQMHPFREGNGRSTKCFLQMIAINHKQFLQYNPNETEAIKD